jgi:hypothetical protein
MLGFLKPDNLYQAVSNFGIFARIGFISGKTGWFLKKKKTETATA